MPIFYGRRTKVFLFRALLCVCVVMCFMLWGHKSVHPVTLWGLASLLVIKRKCPSHKSLNFKVKAWGKVGIRVRVRGVVVVVMVRVSRK